MDKCQLSHDLLGGGNTTTNNSEGFLFPVADKNLESGLASGEVVGHFQSTAEVTLTKVPKCSGAPVEGGSLTSTPFL